MADKIAVPESIRDSFKTFLSDEDIPLEIAADATFKVVEAEPHCQSDTETLNIGGWIACPDAFAVAGRLNISHPQLGELLNHLDIRVRHCQLGCFK